MRTTGQLLRMIGLLIEMVGAVAVVRERGGDQGFRVRIPGGSTYPAAWVAVAVGFVVWLVGRTLIAATRPPRRNEPPSGDLLG
jgi:hypothetical protein